MKKRDNIVCVRFDDDKIKRMDKLINEDKFDSRSSFVRLAVTEKLTKLEPKINF